LFRICRFTEMKGQAEVGVIKCYPGQKDKLIDYENIEGFFLYFILLFFILLFLLYSFFRLLLLPNRVCTFHLFSKKRKKICFVFELYIYFLYFVMYYFFYSFFFVVCFVLCFFLWYL
jgi:hypothetical protein